MQGHKIQASIPNDLVATFDDQIREGFMYQMTSLAVEFNHGHLRPCYHRYKLLFTEKSKVQPFCNPSMPVYGFSLVGADSITERKQSFQYMVGK
jgi:hypothetical protein